MSGRKGNGQFDKGNKLSRNGGRKSRAEELQEWSLEQERPSSECEVRERFRIMNEAWGLFRVRLSQECFPDFVLETTSGKVVRAEVEVASRNFETHKHDPSRCDLLICWRHNWRDCPVAVMPIEQLWWAWQKVRDLDSATPE